MAQTHHYYFDTATQYNDSIGSTHFSNSYGSIYATGKINQCYQSTYNMMGTISAATSANPLPTSGSFSIALWFFPYSSTGASGIFNIYNNSTLLTALRLYGNPGTNTLTFYDSSSNTHTLSSAITYNAWNHLVIIWNGTSWSYYFNGSAKTPTGTAPSATGALSSSCVFQLMGENSAGGYYIDDLRIYNAAIDATEISFIYNAGTGTQSVSGGATTTTTTTAAPALSFPSVPSSGQTYSYGNRMWRYTGTGWEIILPRGSSGLLQYNNSNYLAGASGLAYAASGTILTNTAQAATDIPLAVKAAASQSANLQEWQNSSGTALASVGPSGNFTLSPYSSGTGQTSELRFAELAANGSSYVGFKAPDSIAANNIWTLPSADGGKGQYLSTNGSDTLSWNAGPYPCQGRLTLSSGNPVPSSDVTAASTVYFTPYLGDVVSLWNSTSSTWENFNFTEISLSLTGYFSDTNFDIFIYNNGGTPTLTAGSWSSNTARATGLTTQNGVLVASGTPAYRYLGTIRTNIGASTTEDSVALRLVWNYYNRVIKSLRRSESTTSWTYGSTGSTVARYQFNSSSNRVDVVCGEPQGIEIGFFCDSSRNAAGTTFMGVNYQTTGVSGTPGGTTAVLQSCGSNANMLSIIQGVAMTYGAHMPIGYASFGAVEYNNATTFTSTFYGVSRSGLRGTWAC